MAPHTLAPHTEIYSAFLALLLNQTKTTAVSDERLSLKKMTYPEVETMAFQLSLQLDYLEEQGFSLLFWQPSDIVVIPNATQTLYLLANLAQMVPLDKKDRNNLVLIYPTVFPLPQERCAPELLKMNALPFRTHRSASYYSLALLCLEKLNLSLQQIEGSKLFYFLERCLQEEPKERTLVFF